MTLFGFVDTHKFDNCSVSTVLSHGWITTTRNDINFAEKRINFDETRLQFTSRGELPVHDYAMV